MKSTKTAIPKECVAAVNAVTSERVKINRATGEKISYAMALRELEIMQPFKGIDGHFDIFRKLES